jgi:hypothetical protein
MRWSNEIQFSNTSTLLIDADYSEVITARFFPGIGKYTEIKAKLSNLYVRQVTDRVISKRAVTEADNEKGEPSKAARELRWIIETEAARYEDTSATRVLAVSYQDFEKELKGIAADIPGVEVDHFNNVRGQDRWRNVGSLIVAGRTQPGVRSLERDAMALFWLDQAPVIRIPPAKDGDYNYLTRKDWLRTTDGRTRCIAVQYHPDKRCDEILRQVRECELMQVIGRARLVHRPDDQPCRVTVLCNIPLPMLPVDELVAWKDAVPNPLLVSLARHGVVPLNKTMLAERVPDLIGSERTAARATAALIEWLRQTGAYARNRIGAKTPIIYMRRTDGRTDEVEGALGVLAPISVRAFAARLHNRGVEARWLAGRRDPIPTAAIEAFSGQSVLSLREMTLMELADPEGFAAAGRLLSLIVELWAAAEADALSRHSMLDLWGAPMNTLRRGDFMIRKPVGAAGLLPWELTTHGADLRHAH